MKRLLLTRHAKSSWDHPDLRDIDRPLNNRGLKTAPIIGCVLKRLDYIPEAIFISPTKRTRMTAQLLANELEFPQDQIKIIDFFYGASSSEIVHKTRQISDKIETAMLIGHNPTWTELCQRLTGEYLQNLPTCGVIVIEFDAESWSQLDDHNGQLKDVLAPKDFIS